MSEEVVGGFSGKPLVDGFCNLCGEPATGNQRLFLCKLHIAVIIKEFGEGLNQRWHSEFRAKIVEEINEALFDYFNSPDTKTVLKTAQFIIEIIEGDEK